MGKLFPKNYDNMFILYVALMFMVIIYANSVIMATKPGTPLIWWAGVVVPILWLIYLVVWLIYAIILFKKHNKSRQAK